MDTPQVDHSGLGLEIADLVDEWGQLVGWNGGHELTPEQKAVLLKIRKNTMSAVMGLAEKLDQLESSLAEQAMAAVPPDQLAALVDKISDLKTEATMVHLRCIYDTMEILDDRQLASLLDMSGTP